MPFELVKWAAVNGNAIETCHRSSSYYRLLETWECSVTVAATAPPGWRLIVIIWEFDMGNDTLLVWNVPYRGIRNCQTLWPETSTTRARSFFSLNAPCRLVLQIIAFGCQMLFISTINCSCQEKTDLPSPSFTLPPPPPPVDMHAWQLKEEINGLPTHTVIHN